MSTHVRETDEARFDDEVIKASAQHPVLVDFWAQWCGPCRQLGPVLEQLAGEYEGAFTLVKVDADSNGALAQRFGVRGLPTVKVFRDGEVVDEFVGALPEPALREFIDKHLDSPADQLMREALELARGNPDAGIELLRRGAELEPDNHKIRLALAELLIANNLYDEAATLLTALPANIATSDAARVLQSRLELRRLLAPADDDNDTAVATWRATRELFEQGQYDAALDTLGELVEQRDERARDAMLKLFALPEVDNDSRTRWRRRLASLLN